MGYFFVLEIYYTQSNVYSPTVFLVINVSMTELN